MLARATRPPYTRAVLIAILLCAFALRLINLTVQPLWFDEGWSVWFATSGLPAMIAATARDIHPPLYYALLHGWIALAGHGELALRFLSVMIGVVGVALSAKLAAALFDDPRVSLLAGLLVAVSPLQIFYAQEIRMYGLVTLLGVASSWLFWRAATADRRPRLRGAVRPPSAISHRTSAVSHLPSAVVMSVSRCSATRPKR